MALENRISNSYDPSQGFAGGIRNLGTILTAGPAIRARGNLVNAEADRYRAMAGQSRSVAANKEASTQDLLRKGRLVDTIQKIYPIAEAKMRANDFNDPAVQDYLGAASALTGLDKGNLAEFAKKSLGTRLGLGGQGDLAADVENPVSTANNRRDVAERAARPVTIPSGGTMATPAGTILAQGGATIPQGDIRTGPVAGTGAPAVIARNPKGITPDVQRNKLISDLMLKRYGDTTNAVSDIAGEYDRTANPLAARIAGASGAGATPKAITDNSGQKWIYHGTMADPTKDTDEDNWEMSQ